VAKLELGYEVHFRDDMGRFRSALDAAATKTVEDTADELKEEVVRLAPSGPARRDYGRRPKLKKSFVARMISSRSAVVGSDAGHAKPQEEGAGAHTIRTEWPHGEEHTIQHPGHEGKFFMRRAIDKIMPAFLKNADKNYPG
jgi:hypothetical protein